MPCVLVREEDAKNGCSHHENASSSSLVRRLKTQSLERNQVTWLPAFVEPGIQRPIQAQDREPALSRHRGYPVRRLPRRRFRAEPDRRAAIGIGFDVAALAADAREGRTRRLQQGTRLRVVVDERPEIPGGDAIRQRQ